MEGGGRKAYFKNLGGSGIDFFGSKVEFGYKKRGGMNGHHFISNFIFREEDRRLRESLRAMGWLPAAIRLESGGEE